MGNSDQQVRTPQFEKRAQEAVESYLKIKDFIETHKEGMFKKLEDCHSRAEDNPEGDMRFIVEVLPFVNAIVHVGSKMANFKEAKKWVNADSPKADVVSILSALTFLYIVDKGLFEFAQVGEKGKLWQEINLRTRRILLKSHPPVAQPEAARPFVN